MLFKPGQSGNPGGRVKDKPWAEALRLAVMGDDRRKLRDIAEKCADAAMAGDMQAMKEIGDRLDGKAIQESNVHVSHSRANELSDNELADIAVGSGEGVDKPPLDPSQLN